MGKIEQAIDRAIKRERIRLQEAETARQMVAPLVGNIAGMDSAIEIYSNALSKTELRRDLPIFPECRPWSECCSIPLATHLPTL